MTKILSGYRNEVDSSLDMDYRREQDETEKV